MIWRSLCFEMDQSMLAHMDNREKQPSVVKDQHTLEMPLARSQSIALSMSPSLAPRAFLQSIIGAPDDARSVLTMEAVTACF